MNDFDMASVPDDEDAVPTTEASDFDGGDPITDEEAAYLQTKAMGDEDRAALLTIHKSDLTADTRSIFMRDTNTINPDTAKVEIGHWCELCKKAGLTWKHCYL
ncbi:hypothetical protein BJ138DRAFT_728147 [Hygrophoropsis aurantiaca]|uniref:Uncharacterized protein n=1 Tax=Hygrophoropsis aurantiaca TaxID=72124 RepID=A0ACB7ZXW8_9AGAM|nr:hypothetical protein BJ138DRAFT_728147 [Hygrophoropsis aurantiaca]